MTGARHRRARSAASIVPQPDGGDRLALVFLTVVGLAGPTWALHEQATPLLDGADHRPSAIAADASPSSDR
ncbi:hypothetical protein [Streptomyces sp. NBC_00209]|uniref:hypothetical protein n=1 Tax=Streptomyces sp. NBC_00209 TaxID=2975682 RepID=UPI00325185B1